MARRLTWLDVFTSRPLTGNGLAVVHHADGIDDATMLAFARETKLSETTFIQTRDRAGRRLPQPHLDDRRRAAVRGPSVARDRGRRAHARAEREAHYVQQTGAGLQPVDVELGVSGVARASMLQEPVVFGAEVDPEWVLGALGLEPADAHPELPPQVVRPAWRSSWFPCATRASWNRVRPDAAQLGALLRELGVICVYLASHDPAHDAPRRAATSRPTG